jgi:hypothetical protein
VPSLSVFFTILLRFTPGTCSFLLNLNYTISLLSWRTISPKLYFQICTWPTNKELSGSKDLRRLFMTLFFPAYPCLLQR